MAREQFNTSHNIQILNNVLLFLLIGLTALVVLSQANPGLNFAKYDYGNYAYIGQQITLGKLPYKDVWESKPPAIFYVDAIGLWIAHGFRWGIWTIEFICLVIAAYLSYILIKRIWGGFPALCGTMLWLAGLNILLDGGNNTEEFPLPLHFLALILFVRLVEVPENYLDGLVLGLAFSISFLFRANNAVTETAVVLTLLLIWMAQRNFRVVFRQLISMGIGAITPILITAVYFWKQGLLKALYNAAIVYNLVYSKTHFSNTPPGLAGFNYLGIVAWVALIGFGIALILWIKQWRTQSSSIFLLLLIGCPLAILTSDPAQRNYEHYYINWLPFISLSSGLFFYAIQSKLTSYLKSTAWANLLYTFLALTFVVFFFVQSGMAAQNWTSFANVLNRSEIERNSVASVYVEEHTKLNDLVLVWGGFTDINFMSRRTSPTAYVLYPLLLDSNLSTQYSNQFLVDIQKNRPVLIIDMKQGGVPSLNIKTRSTQENAHDLWPYLPANINEVLKFIDDNYHFEIDFKGTVIYRLNSVNIP